MHASCLVGDSRKVDFWGDSWDGLETIEYFLNDGESINTTKVR